MVSIFKMMFERHCIWILVWYWKGNKGDIFGCRGEEDGSKNGQRIIVVLPLAQLSSSGLAWPGLWWYSTIISIPRVRSSNAGRPGWIASSELQMNHSIAFNCNPIWKPSEEFRISSAQTPGMDLRQSASRHGSVLGLDAFPIGSEAYKGVNKFCSAQHFRCKWWWFVHIHITPGTHVMKK